MNNTSSNWKQCKLGSLGEFKNGVNFKKDDKGNGIRIINVKDIFIDGTKINFDSLDEVSLSDKKGIEKYCVKNNDIFFVRSSVKRDGVGLVAMVDRNDKETVHCGFVIRFRPTTKQINSLFLTYLLRSYYYRKTIIGVSSGVAITNISQENLANIEINIPPLPTQKKIAAILSAYDDLIENNTRRIKILEEMAQMIYREWFVNFRFPGHEKVKMVDSEIGPIPEGWEIKAIGDIIQILGGGTPSTKNEEYWENGRIIWYSPTDLTSSGSMFISDSSKKITSLGLKNSSAKLFPPYSVMMTSRATIGVVSINTKESCTNQGFINCIPNDKVSVYHLYYWVIENKEKIISLASGATFKEINRSTFKTLPIIIPNNKISQSFYNIVSPICCQILNLLNKNKNLRQTRDLLLPKLISGELDVSKLDIDTGRLDT